MTTPRRLRRPEAKREHKALVLAAKARRQGFHPQRWQVDSLRRIFDHYGSLEQFQSQAVRAFTFPGGLA